jgi:hypothetical protein
MDAPDRSIVISELLNSQMSLVSTTQPSGPVADLNVVVRFHRSPAIVRVAGPGGDVELGAVGSTFEWLSQPACVQARTTTRIAAVFLIVPHDEQRRSRPENADTGTAFQFGT